MYSSFTLNTILPSYVQRMYVPVLRVIPVYYNLGFIVSKFPQLFQFGCDNNVLINGL